MVPGRPEYRIGTVSAVTGMNPSTLNGLINDGYHMGLYAQSRAKGQFRPFTVEDVIRVKVFGDLRTLGVTKPIAHQAAQAVGLTYMDARFYKTPLFLVIKRNLNGGFDTAVIPAKSYGVPIEDDLTVVLPLTPLVDNLIALLDAFSGGDEM
jgi:hypothetical protein